MLGNFRVIMKYNPAEAYALAIGHLADRLRGGASFVQAWPRDERALSMAERFEMQQLLARRGFDIGEPDGLLGPRTRVAIRGYQAATDNSRRLRVEFGARSPAPALTLARNHYLIENNAHNRWLAEAGLGICHLISGRYLLTRDALVLLSRSRLSLARLRLLAAAAAQLGHYFRTPSGKVPCEPGSSWSALYPQPQVYEPARPPPPRKVDTLPEKTRALINWLIGCQGLRRFSPTRRRSASCARSSLIQGPRAMKRGPTAKAVASHHRYERWKSQAPSW